MVTIPRHVDDEDAMAGLEHEDMYRPGRAELDDDFEEPCHRSRDLRHSPAETTERKDEVA